MVPFIHFFGRSTPHLDTTNRVLSKVLTEVLEKIKLSFSKALLSKDVLKYTRISSEYAVTSIDGVTLQSFDKEQGGTTSKVSKNGKNH